ncbi:MAG: SRPBCC domain-containing protein [Chloroflexi bacterium]|nr:SRPBCC domain-containing protein [Chloroflexota bacterium]
MDHLHSLELQAEVDAPRERVYELLATAKGLGRWLDEAELEARFEGPVRIRMTDAVATGQVLSIQPPQHISFSWAWEGEDARSGTVVAFDAIDHGSRTHVTVRQVGFRTREQRSLHEALWAYWFGRFQEAVESRAREPEGRSAG